MAVASVLFARGIVLIIQDYSRPDVLTGENTAGLVIVTLLMSASTFEAYRFLSFLLRQHRAFRHGP